SRAYGSPEAYVQQWRAGHDDILELLVAFYSLQEGATYFDIGCQYGTSAMEVALFLRSIGRKVPIFAFDCGLAGVLAPMNIENNGYHNEIVFYPAAIGSINKYVLVHRDLGFTADNRIVNGAFLWERGSLSLPVKCVTLDAFFESHHIDVPFIAKIDTQGAEP